MQQKPLQQTPSLPMQLKPSCRSVHCPSWQVWQVGVLPHVCPFLAGSGRQLPLSHLPHPSPGQSPSSQQTRHSPSQQRCPVPHSLGLHWPASQVSHEAHSSQHSSAPTHVPSGQQRWSLWQRERQLYPAPVRRQSAHSGHALWFFWQDPLLQVPQVPQSAPSSFLTQVRDGPQCLQTPQL
jgi:hypothetical protein